MTQEVTSNKRILKNTVMLYFRMLVLMLISFYTSRVILKALGVEDYGIYNVVGGIVGMLAFVNSSMTMASNRYLAFAIGQGNKQLLQITFSTSLLIHFIIALIVVLLSETVGLWFFYKFLNIPPASLNAAYWVYQISIITAFMGICTVPLTATVTAHENMSAFAIISLLEGGMKLGVAFMLSIPFLCNLIDYAIMMFIVSLAVVLCWFCYVRNKYPYCRYRLTYDRKMTKEMFGFIGWQMIGSLSWMLRNTGANLVLNHFFGPILNTARSIANQVNGGITSLVSNFQTASNPQLVKYFALKEIPQMKQLLYRSSKLSFILISVFAIPIFFNVEPILKFWLGEIPPYASVFVSLAILATIADSLSGTMNQTVAATGKIKYYNLVNSCILGSYILFQILAFSFKLAPYSMMWIEIAMYFIVFISRLILSHKIYGLSIRDFLVKVTVRELLVLGLSFGLIGLIMTMFNVRSLSLFINLGYGFLITCCVGWIVGLNQMERTWAIALIKGRFCHKN